MLACCGACWMASFGTTLQCLVKQHPLDDAPGSGKWTGKQRGHVSEATYPHTRLLHPPGPWRQSEPVCTCQGYQAMCRPLSPLQTS